MSDKTCSQCSSQFTCDIENGEKTCWCFDLPNIIPLDSIADSKASEAGCLCPDCLQARIDALSASQPKS